MKLYSMNSEKACYFDWERIGHKQNIVIYQKTFQYQNRNKKKRENKFRLIYIVRSDALSVSRNFCYLNNPIMPVYPRTHRLKCCWTRWEFYEMTLPPCPCIQHSVLFLGPNLHAKHPMPAVLISTRAHTKKE